MSNIFKDTAPSKVASLPALSEANVDATDFAAPKYATAPASINAPSIHVAAELPQPVQPVQPEPAQPAGGKSKIQI
jgi:hypothetical protein